jgi:DNA-binding phage protein
MKNNSLQQFFRYALSLIFMSTGLSLFAQDSTVTTTHTSVTTSNATDPGVQTWMIVAGAIVLIILLLVFLNRGRNRDVTSSNAGTQSRH